MSSHAGKVSRRRSETGPSLVTQLRLACAFALLAAAITAITIYWEGALDPPERVINIYRTHGCLCVFHWANSLKAQGFVVRMYEYETLEYVRKALRVPESLSSCHVGKYLGYFLEGHVSGPVLLEIAKKRPVGFLGLAAIDPVKRSGSKAAVTAESPVLVVDLDGRTRPWPPPNEPHG